MKASRTTSGKYTVEAVDKALDVLDCFRGPEELSLAEISERVALNKSRAFRLLQTLSVRGYVQRTGDGYQLGPKLVERGSTVRRDLRAVARDSMRKLHVGFNEAVNLSVFEQGNVLYLDILESARPFRMSAAIGCRMPAAQTSMGKAILARMDGDSAMLAAALREVPRSELTGLERELSRIRKRGYAVDSEENEPGVACVGCAILDWEGQPAGAISVSGPAHRILGNEKAIGSAVVAAASEISRRLGYTGQEQDRL
jgi:DNA-binding IclR family transcriptional regulator